MHARRALPAAVLVVLVVVAALLRSRWWGGPYWIDEAISVGIARHGLLEIPGLLRLDGSPPLYLWLLHVHMALFGTGPAATHALSAALAVLAVPAAWWAAAPFGRWASAAAAAIVATNPFVGLYAVETRMYSLALLLGLLATGALLRGPVAGDPRRSVAFGLLLAAVLLTHNWGLFFAAACLAATLVHLLRDGSRRRLRAAAVGFGLAGGLYAPWVPTLVGQAQLTGAPWSIEPRLHAVVRGSDAMLGGALPRTLLLGAGTLGIAVLVAHAPRLRAPALTVASVAVATIALGWVASRVGQPAWALRYLAVVLAPLTVALGAGLGQARPFGVALVAAIALTSWTGEPTRGTLLRKSNAPEVAAAVAPRLPPGSLVVSTQPEQVPNLALHLPRGLRYVTPLGAARDPGVVDWRNALARLRQASFRRDVRPAVRALPPGARVLFVRPVFRAPTRAWTKRIAALSGRWERALRREGLRPFARVRPRRGFRRSTVSAVLFALPRERR